MILVLKRAWEVKKVITDDSGKVLRNENTLLGPGEFRMKKVLNPLGHPGVYWLVLEEVEKNTIIGGAVRFWEDWSEEKWGDFQVIIKK
jgi:hypothetical protein